MLNPTTQFSIKQAGVSLIEVLVTTLILGIGLLGVAALQVSSISSSQEGFYYSQATSLAEDLASRMRAAKLQTLIPSPNGGDPVAYATYLSHYVSTKPIACDTAPATCRSDGGTLPASCTLKQIAEYELADACWNAKQTLPDSNVRVLQNSDRLTVVVEWAAASARSDLGQKTNINSSCNSIINNNEKNCILLEIVP